MSLCELHSGDDCTQYVWLVQILALCVASGFKLTFLN